MFLSDFIKSHPIILRGISEGHGTSWSDLITPDELVWPQPLNVIQYLSTQHFEIWFWLSWIWVDIIWRQLIKYDCMWNHLNEFYPIYLIPFHLLAGHHILFRFSRRFFDVIESRLIIRSGLDLIRSDLTWSHLITCDLKCSHKIQLDLIWFNLNESIVFSWDPFWSNFTQVWGCHHRLTEVEWGQMVN